MKELRMKLVSASSARLMPWGSKFSRNELGGLVKRGSALILIAAAALLFVPGIQVAHAQNYDNCGIPNDPTSPPCVGEPVCVAYCPTTTPSSGSSDNGLGLDTGTLTTVAVVSVVGAAVAIGSIASSNRKPKRIERPGASAGSSMKMEQPITLSAKEDWHSQQFTSTNDSGWFVADQNWADLAKEKAAEKIGDYAKDKLVETAVKKTLGVESAKEVIWKDLKAFLRGADVALWEDLAKAERAALAAGGGVIDFLGLVATFGGDTAPTMSQKIHVMAIEQQTHGVSFDDIAKSMRDKASKTSYIVDPATLPPAHLAQPVSFDGVVNDEVARMVTQGSL